MTIGTMPFRGWRGRFGCCRRRTRIATAGDLRLVTEDACSQREGDTPQSLTVVSRLQRSETLSRWRSRATGAQLIGDHD
jgi:hypothetical protein